MQSSQSHTTIDSPRTKIGTPRQSKQEIRSMYFHERSAARADPARQTRVGNRLKDAETSLASVTQADTLNAQLLQRCDDLTNRLA